jgi:hypothetical protein
MKESIPYNLDEMVCDRCGSDHISIKMFGRRVGSKTIFITGVTSATVESMITVM